VKGFASRLQACGRAPILGVHQWWVHPDDEVGEGFLLL